MVMALLIELFTARVIYRVSYRVLEYSTDTKHSNYRVVQNKLIRIKATLLLNSSGDAIRLGHQS